VNWGELAKKKLNQSFLSVKDLILSGYYRNNNQQLVNQIALGGPKKTQPKFSG